MTRIVTMLAIGVACNGGVLVTRAASADQSQSTAQSNWKNLQVLAELKSKPESALYDTMDAIAGALGVGCNNCHIGQFDADVKPAKSTARDMIKMTRAINDANFGGRAIVTCQTCHQGHAKPDGLASAVYRTPEELAAARQAALARQTGTAAAAAAAPVPLPAVETVLANYRRAVGAASLRSLRITATSADLFLTGAIEITAVYPDQIRFVLTNSTGQTSQQIANHDHGWLAGPDVRTAMTDNQLKRFIAAARGWIFLPAALDSSAAVVTGVERIGRRDCVVVQSETAAGVERLYFDRESSLLVKMHREIQTPVGASVRDTEWLEYRDVNGVKRPSRIVDHLMSDELDYAVTDMQDNPPVDAAIFEPPAPKPRVAITLPAAALDAVAGTYQLAADNTVTISRDGTRLFLTQNGARLEIFAESPTEFFITTPPVQLTFVKGPDGTVSSMIVHQNGGTRECPRVK